MICVAAWLLAAGTAYSQSASALLVPGDAGTLSLGLTQRIPGDFGFLGLQVGGVPGRDLRSAGSLGGRGVAVVRVFAAGDEQRKQEREDEKQGGDPGFFHGFVSSFLIPFSRITYIIAHGTENVKGSEKRLAASG